MSNFICPVCGCVLFSDNQTYKCANSHSFDISKYKYVNLLMSSQSKLKHHGDDRLMVQSRKSFLDSGAYSPLADSAKQMISDYCHSDITLLDVGCGEGYYSQSIISYLESQGVTVSSFGIDISKDALRYASTRLPNTKLAVASAYNLPIESNSCDFIINFFSPYVPDEYCRVLKPTGYLLRAVPLENHLFDLKKAIYDNPYPNPRDDMVLDGFKIVSKKEIAYNLHLDSNLQIINLFKMTPYYYKTGKKDQDKLSTINEMDTRIEFGLALYRPSHE